MAGISTYNSILRNLGKLVEAAGSSNSTPGLVVVDHKQPTEPVCLIGRDEGDGSAAFMLLRPGAEEGDIVAKLLPGGPSGIHVRRIETSAQIQLNVFPTGQPAILVRGGNATSIALTIDPENSAPELLLADREGRTRASLRLDEDGTPELKFFDEEGNTTWCAGRDA